MASRKRRSKAPARIVRRRQTQTQRREILIARMEREFAAVVQAQKRDAQKLLENWIRANAKPETVDAGEAALIAALRGVFRSTKNLQAFFGRMASLIGSDAETVVHETIPIIGRRRVVSSPAIARFTRTNADLVKSLGGAQVDRLAKVIRVGEGLHAESLGLQIEQAFDVTEARAKFWARDQTLKLHSQITQERYAQAGIARYFWTDSNDERVRNRHGELGEMSDQGKTFSYKDPPITSEPEDSDVRRNNPGEDYNCRCTAYPDL